jgi:hypothetical protein
MFPQERLKVQLFFKQWPVPMRFRQLPQDCLKFQPASNAVQISVQTTLQTPDSQLRNGPFGKINAVSEKISLTFFVFKNSLF